MPSNPKLTVTVELDQGPWCYGQTKESPPRVFVESDDFSTDVRLYVDGDFSSLEHKRSYAQGIAHMLNAFQKAAKATKPQSNG